MILNLPNFLTLTRIGIIPIIILTFYLPGDFWNWVAFTLFIIACITDFFDGYFARKREEFSDFGTLLDPIADKLLVATVLFLLARFDYLSTITTIAAIIILCREILVSGLREYLSGEDETLPVTFLAKWKTTIQMTAIAILIIAPEFHQFVWVLGEFLLWGAAVITLHTGYIYCQAALEKMQKY